MIRLSIIIPVFGVEKYISRCLDSVFSISLPESDFEVICVDDCSKDHSVQIIEGYQSQHNNLRLLHHPENLRQGGARNTGIKVAQGEFVVFVDGDDRMPNYDVSAIIDYMQSKGLELWLGAAEVYKQNGAVTRWGEAPQTASEIMPGPDVFVGEYIHRIAFGVVWMGIYRIGLLHRVSPFVEKVSYEDADWTMRCAYEAQSVQYQPVVVYNYMENETSTTKTPSVEKTIDRVRQGLRVWEWAQTTVERHDEVLVAAEDFCTWNLSCLKSLSLYRHSDRKRFYDSFSKEEFSVMKQWKMGGKWMKVVRKPIMSRFAMAAMSPFLRLGKTIKNKLIK
jgi:glycosyltransferase involved in cell wall biosynthesis